MSQEQHGQRFERWVKRELRDRGCVIGVDSYLDRCDSVDYFVRAVGTEQFRYPVEIQITLLHDDLLKLRWYRESRGFRKAASLYVEASRSPTATANAIYEMLLSILELGREASNVVFAICVDRDRSWSRFDLSEKIATLEAQATPAVTGHLRRDGTIAGFEHGRFIIASGEHVFRAWSSEVADPKLVQLKKLGTISRGVCAGIEVSFIPKENGYAASLIAVPPPVRVSRPKKRRQRG